MINLQPVKGVCQKEILDHRTVEIIKKSSPDRMDRHGWIWILIQRCSVKKLKTSFHSRKMRRCPVKDQTDPCLVEFIDNFLKILWCAKSSGRCIISKCAVFSCFVIKVFHDRMQLYMSIVQFLYKICELCGILPFCQRSFIDGDRLFAVAEFLTLLHPGLIFPLEYAGVCHNRCICRWNLGACCVWIRFQLDPVSLEFQFIFVDIPCFHTRDKKFKDTGHRHSVHRMASSVPRIEITYNTDTHRVRCPYCKAGSFNAINLHRMCAQFLIRVIINACAESFFLCFCDLTGECIRICKFLCFFSFGDAIFIIRDLSSRDHCCKIACFVFLLHFIFTGADQNFCLICLREKSLDQNAVCRKTRSHDILRRCFLSVNHCFNSRPVHIFVCFAFHNYCLHSEMPVSGIRANVHHCYSFHS